MRESPPSSGPQYLGPARVIPIIARISVNLECLEVSQEAARVVYSVQVEDAGAHGVRLGQALLSVLRADIKAANEHYSALEGTPRYMNGPILCSDRTLGLLSHTLANYNKASEHFEEAQSFCLNANFRPELAWTCCDYADTLLQRNEPGDREKAMSLLDETLAISRELDMRPLMERVLSRREILKA